MKILNTAYDIDTDAPARVEVSLTVEELAFITQLVGNRSPANVAERHRDALESIWEGGARFFNRHYFSGVDGFEAGEEAR